MTEDFIHFIWRTRNFQFLNLRTTEGALVEIQNFGQWNTGAGPDFVMARVRIDDTEWAGNIEMHLSASEWGRHGHTDDPVYASVVLHVVLEEDRPAYAGTRRIPCIELKNKIDSRLLGQYLRLMANSAWVPCAAHLPHIDPVKRALWIERMLVERLQSRTEIVNVRLKASHQDWEEAFYQSIATAYGFKTNAAPFERLARLLPLKYVLRHHDSLVQLEALYFGCAGLLNQLFTDDYPVRLQKEYAHLSKKYALGMIDAHAWKSGRLRPANFPWRRIAQFAALMTRYQGLFRATIDASNISALRILFDTPVSDYWSAHYTFDKPTGRRLGNMGSKSIDGILINTVAPFLYCYGVVSHDSSLIDRSIALLSTLSGEENGITKKWAVLGMPNTHAGQSQGLIHLKQAYCNQRRCVECALGNEILTSEAPGNG